MAWALPAPTRPVPDTRYDHALAAHPEDAALQVAGALRQGGNKVALARLRERAPGQMSPFWRAAILRYACMGELRLSNRNVEQGKLSAHPDTTSKDTPVDSVALERGLTDAQRGAEIDPTNAFFPAMEALTLYGLKRDTEAQAALKRAANCPHFDDGVRDEALGSLRLREAALGPQLALTETAVAAALLLPHYAHLRTLARLATVQAMEKEQAGDMAGGLALRAAVMELSEKLREHSSTYIGTLVGTAMIQIALSRPGGAPAVTAKSLGLAQGCEDDCSEEQEAERKNRTEKIAAERLRQWEAFATKHGRAELVALFVKSRESKEEQQKIYESTTERSVFGISRMMVQTLAHLTALNLLLSVVAVVLMGGLGKLALRRWPTKQAATPAVGWGLALVFFPLLLPVALWKLRKAPGSWGRRLGLLSAAWLLPYVGLFLLVRAEAGAIAPWLATVGLLQGMSAGTSTSDPALQGHLYSWLALTGSTLLLPLLWLAALALVSAVRRVPATHGIAQGAARTALPLSATLCLAYALLLPWVATQERQLKHELREMAVSERHYLARLAAQSQP